MYVCTYNILLNTVCMYVRSYNIYNISLYTHKCMYVCTYVLHRTNWGQGEILMCKRQTPLKGNITY